MYRILLILISIFIFYCCKEKENNSGDPSQPLVFTSLQANRYTIEAGDTTKIIANASGYKIEYFWAASAGGILGGGAEVIYAASPCQAGENTITCMVKDGNGNSEKKEIIILVQ
jgi:hypothetical protein